MRYRTVNNLIRLGARVLTMPRYHTTVVVSGSSYYYVGGIYYVKRGGAYVIVSAPPGAIVYSVPTTTTVVYASSTPYLYYSGAFYVTTTTPAPQPPPKTKADDTIKVAKTGSTPAGKDAGVSQELPKMIKSTKDENYKVTAPPVGATVPYIPTEADSKTIGGKKYFVYSGTYYRPFASDGETIYMVVADPNKPAA
jgi:hypothetical protein